MLVKLNKSDQFGPRGPQRGEGGEAHNLIVVDDDAYLLVSFNDKKFHRQQFWVRVDDVLWYNPSDPDLSPTTLRGAALATPPEDTTNVTSTHHS